MDSIDRLLSSEARLAEALRWNLHGLRAALHAALLKNPNDPGAAACRDLLGDLDHRLESDILAGRTGEMALVPPPIPEPAPVVPPPANTSALAPFWKRAEDDSELQKKLGPFALPADDVQAWYSFHRLMLRASAQLSKRWREQLEIAVASAGLMAGTHPDGMDAIPGDRDEVICPSLHGSISAMGLRQSTQALLDSRLSIRMLDADFEILARVVSASLAMLRLEPELRHTLKSLYPYGADPFKHVSREAYETELIARFNRVQNHEMAGKAGAAFKARLDLDEAIHSLVFAPPPERDSWWGALQQQARNTLNQAAARVRLSGLAVELQWLWGAFSNVTQRIDRSSFEMAGGAGKPGEVSACLRVYARIGDEILPGRVIYRPL